MAVFHLDTYDLRRQSEILPILGGFKETLDGSIQGHLGDREGTQLTRRHFKQKVTFLHLGTPLQNQREILPVKAKDQIEPQPVARQIQLEILESRV